MCKSAHVPRPAYTRSICILYIAFRPHPATYMYTQPRPSSWDLHQSSALQMKRGCSVRVTELGIVWVWIVNAHIAQNDSTHHDARSADWQKGLMWLLALTRWADYWAHDCNSTWTLLFALLFMLFFPHWSVVYGFWVHSFGTCSRSAPRLSGWLSPPTIQHSVIM